MAKKNKPKFEVIYSDVFSPILIDKNGTVVTVPVQYNTYEAAKQSAANSDLRFAGVAVSEITIMREKK